MPTLARVLVAETWETRTVLEDYSILDSLLALGVSFTDEAKAFHVQRCREVNKHLLPTTTSSSSNDGDGSGKDSVGSTNNKDRKKKKIWK